MADNDVTLALLVEGVDRLEKNLDLFQAANLLGHQNIAHDIKEVCEAITGTTQIPGIRDRLDNLEEKQKHDHRVLFGVLGGGVSLGGALIYDYFTQKGQAAQAVGFQIAQWWAQYIRF